MISGFLMALILTQGYTSKRNFYLNRFLRIYPAYFVAIVLGLISFLVFPNSSHDAISSSKEALKNSSIYLVLWSLISNLTLIGIDLTRYIKLNPEDFSFSFPNFMFGGGGGGQNLLFVPQAWTLAIEIQFYLLAPILVKLKSQFLMVATAFFFFLRIFVYHTLRAHGFPIDDGAIFMLQIQYFLLGILAYRYYSSFAKNKMEEDIKNKIAFVFTVLSASLILFGKYYLQRHDRLGYDVFYLAFAITIPFQFYSTRNSKVDRVIGEYSYPIYLFHYAIMLALLTFDFGNWLGEIVLALTVLVSGAYISTADKKIKLLRNRIRSAIT
jgi:peptidoglycan/LPS O-acetylase OafA/YrhL